MKDNEHEQQNIRRFRELAERAAKTGSYTYTSFHSREGAALAFRVASEREIKLWGGAECCERVVIRFGDPEEIGYEEPFPIRLMYAGATQPKFSEELGHRDFLGAIMNLGIERDVTGDIFVCEGGAYFFIMEEMADYVRANLERVRHTSVRCREAEEVPEDCLPRLIEETVTVSSIRLDAILARLCHLSRSEAKALFDSEKVSLNGRICSNPDTVPPDDSRLSVRGYGRFQYLGEARATKKGKLAVTVQRYG